MMAAAYQRRIEHEAKMVAAQAVLMMVPPAPLTGAGNGIRSRQPVKKASRHSNPLMGAGDAGALRARQMKQIEQSKK